MTRDQNTDSTIASDSVRRPTPWLPIAGFVVASVAAIVWAYAGAGRYELFIATMFLTMVIAIAGLNILFGFAGQLSLGHGAFFAIGAYMVGVGLVQTSVPFVPLLLIALVVSVLVSLVLVGPTLRVPGSSSPWSPWRTRSSPTSCSSTVAR